MKSNILRNHSSKLLGAVRLGGTNLKHLFSTSKNEKDGQFRNAVAALQLPRDKAAKRDVDNDTKLKLYALFKQAENGTCEGPRPGMFDLVGRAKYDAWKELGNMSKADAMEEYVGLVTKIFDGKLPEVEAKDTTATETTVTSPTSPAPVVAAPKLRSMSDVVFPGKTVLPQPANLQTLKFSTSESGVSTIHLHRPEKGNAFNMTMFEELIQVWAWIKVHPKTRVVVLSSEHETFSTGMDLSVFLQLQSVLAEESCDARKREGLIRFIDYLQRVVTEAEACAVPVISAVSGHCIGGAIDLICASDMRYCTHSATFSVKEIDLAIVADMGTLQRLPRIVGKQQSAELAFTGRNFSGQEAEAMGLVLKSFATKDEMMQHVYRTAEQIAAKSPVTIRGVKKSLNFNENHSVQDSLEHIQLHNSSMVLSEDLATAASAIFAKKTPRFTKD